MKNPQTNNNNSNHNNNNFACVLGSFKFFEGKIEKVRERGERER